MNLQHNVELTRKHIHFMLSILCFMCMLIVVIPSWAATITVDTLLDDGSAGNCELREAMNAARLDTAVDNCIAGDPGADIIDLQGITGTIILTERLPIIFEDLVITGPGPGTLTVDGNDRGRVFEIFGGNHVVEISGLTITGGTFFLPIDIGGGIRVGADATLNLTDSVITGNWCAISGGGIDIAAGATVTLNNTSVTDNAATDYGGGIHNNGGSLTIEGNSVVSENIAYYEPGGGIYNNAGLVTIINSTIGPLNISFSGGGIYNNGGTLTISDSVITSNESTDVTPLSGGGGILDNNGTLTISNSEISDNTASSRAGGIY